MRRAEGARQRPLGIRLERQSVDRAEPHTDFQPRSFGADAFDQFFQESRPVLEATAVRTRSRHRAKKFMSEIAVARFQINEIETAFLGTLRRDNVVFDQALDIVIAQHRPTIRITELSIENRMVSAVTAST